MDKNQKYVITINRELGSGGRTIGRKLAEKLNVPFYDKALINELKQKFNLDTEEIEKLKGSKHQWWRDFINTAMYMGQGMNEVWYYQRMFGQDFHMVTSSEMYEVEKEILENVAEEDSCVIAGRTACYIFRENPNHLSILIQASMPCRMARVAREQNMSKEEARLTIEKVDKMRENYVQEFTGTSRYDTRNYQLVLNMDEINEDAAVDLILAYIRSMAA